MQTFLPLPDFAATARVLDRQRLGKQIIECRQIAQAFTSAAWTSHPAVEMWKANRGCLLLYTATMHREWVRRGYKNPHDAWTNMLEDHMRFWRVQRRPMDPAPPDWLGNPEFHASHRAALLHKDPEHYGQFGWTETAEQAYLWPSNDPTIVRPDDVDLPGIAAARNHLRQKEAE